MSKFINTAKLLHYVDTEGDDIRDTYYLYKLLDAVKCYLYWAAVNCARSGDRFYEKNIDICIMSKEAKQTKLSLAANRVVQNCNKLKISEKFFEREHDLFKERFDVAEELAGICESYGISLQRNFRERAKALEG